MQQSPSCSFHGTSRAPLWICPRCILKLRSMETCSNLMKWDQAMVYFFLSSATVVVAPEIVAVAAIDNDNDDNDGDPSLLKAKNPNNKYNGYMMIDAYDSFNQRGNDSALGRHLEASFKYIKHVLIPHSKRRDRYYQDVHADAVANAAAIATGQSSKLRVAVSSPPSPKTAKMKLYHHRTQQRNQPLLVGRSISKRNLEISWETPASVPECDEKEESSDELSLSSSTSTSEVTSAKSSFADEAGSTGVVMQSRSKSVPANFAVAANVYNKSSSNNTNTNNEKKNAVRDSSTGSHSGRATF